MSKHKTCRFFIHLLEIPSQKCGKLGGENPSVSYERFFILIDKLSQMSYL